MEQRMELEGGGTLLVEQQGPKVRLLAQRPRDDRGLYKVWLQGDRGGRYLLGTLAPEGEELLLRRTLSVGELERCGCWPGFRGRAELAFAFDGGGRQGWYCEGSPQRLIPLPELKRQVPGPLLCKKEGDGFWLAAPFRTDRPVALPGLFCLARVERWRDGHHILWVFDGQGRPRVPEGRSRGDASG